MKGPYGFEPNDSCQSCKRRGNGFCQMPPTALKDFDAITFSSSYPKGAFLFMEKQTPRGIYILCEGEMKLSVSSNEGKTLTLRIAKPGEILGLESALSGNPYELTAETLRPCQVAFIRREAFLPFLAKHPEVYLAVMSQLGSHYQTACEQLRTVGLSASAPEKLAKLLLNFSAGSQEARDRNRVKLPLTHEEIASFIGTTRETVTRTLGDFKAQNLVQIQGSTLMIQNRSALENVASL